MARHLNRFQRRHITWVELYQLVSDHRDDGTLRWNADRAALERRVEHGGKKGRNAAKRIAALCPVFIK